jgi:Zn finger protein HypA/HybF involved in hydrogenase expression
MHEHLLAAQLIRLINQAAEQTRPDTSVDPKLADDPQPEASAEVAPATLSDVWATITSSEPLTHASILMHVSAQVASTALASTRLHLHLRQASAWCESCEQTCSFDHHVPVCARCGGTRLHTIEPDTIRVERAQWRGCSI